MFLLKLSPRNYIFIHSADIKHVTLPTVSYGNAAYHKLMPKADLTKSNPKQATATVLGISPAELQFT
jgi:hypothetical protein